MKISENEIVLVPSAPSTLLIEARHEEKRVEENNFSTNIRAVKKDEVRIPDISRPLIEAYDPFVSLDAKSL